MQKIPYLWDKLLASFWFLPILINLFVIGVAGTVFSITLVTPTLATSQFGSRRLRNFMYDKLNQVVLGVYVSSFVYCLLVLNKAFIVGKVRTPLQDAEFSIHQMVEVASRALSPGVNDPYTATACIDNLGSVMCYLAGAHFPSPYRFDEEDRLRDTLIAIKDFAPSDEKKKELTRHAKMVLRAARRTFAEPRDLKDMEVRYKKLK